MHRLLLHARFQNHDIQAVQESPYDLHHTAAIEVRQAESAVIRRLMATWRNKAGGRLAPRRDELDRLEIPLDAVSRIVIVDVLTEPLDFRYRHFGTWHVDSHGRDMTGRLVSEYDDAEYRSLVMRDYAKVLATQAPTLSLVDMTLKGLPYRCEILRMPLSDDGRTVAKIMAVESPLD